MLGLFYLYAQFICSKGAPMTIKPFGALACPLDGEPLVRESSSWRCPNGHNFDVARQGYVHLLPVQNKRSKDPGDSKAMVAARQGFLNAGHYQPVADAVSAAVLKGVPEASALDCLDAGCGEGYYLRQLESAAAAGVSRSEERRVGKECRSRWAPCGW